MSKESKRTPEEELEAIRERVEAGRVLDEVLDMSEKELDRELRKAGFDVAKIERDARADAARARRSERGARGRGTWIALAVAAGVLLVIAAIWRGGTPHENVAAPVDAATLGDAREDADAR
jgi:hypothetical protein